MSRANRRRRYRRRKARKEADKMKQHFGPSLLGRIGPFVLFANGLWNVQP